MVSAFAMWDAGQIAELRTLLKESIPAAGQTDSRGFEWHYLHHLAHSLAADRLDAAGVKVAALAFSADGRLLAVGGKGDRPLRVWDVETRNLVWSAPVGSPSVAGLAFSPDGKTLATTAGDDQVSIWPAAGGKPLAVLRSDVGLLEALAFTPDSTVLLAVGTISKGANLIRWSLPNGTLQPTIKLNEEKSFAKGEGNRWQLATSPKGDVVHASKSGILKRISLNDPSVASYNVELSAGVSLTTTDRGDVVTGGQEGNLLVLSGTDGRVERKLVGHRGMVNLLSPSRSSIVASAAHDNVVRTWDSATGESLGIFRGHTESVQALALRPDGKQAASSDGKNIFLWHVNSTIGDKLLTSGNLFAVAAIPGTARAIVAGGGYISAPVSDVPALVREVDLTTPTLEARMLQGAGIPTPCVALSPDGEQIAVAYGPLPGSPVRAGGRVELWNAAGSRLLRTLPHPEGTVSFIAFSPNGKTLAATVVSVEALSVAPARVVLWDVQTWQVRHVLTASLPIANSMAFAPDGKFLAAAFYDPSNAVRPGAVGIWNVASGSRLEDLPGVCHATFGVAFAPDGKTLAATSGDVGDLSAPGELLLWNFPARTLRTTLRGHTKCPMAIAFSPDSKQFASCEMNGDILLWDESEKLLAKLSGHKLAASKLAFSADGSRLASCAAHPDQEDLGEPYIWDVAARKTLAKAEGPIGTPVYLEFTRDGKSIVTADGRAATARLWQVDQLKVTATIQSSPVSEEKKGTPEPLAPSR